MEKKSEHAQGAEPVGAGRGSTPSASGKDAEGSLRKDIPLIFDRHAPGAQVYRIPACDVPEEAVSSLIPEALLRRRPARLPEVSEP